MGTSDFLKDLWTSLARTGEPFVSPVQAEGILRKGVETWNRWRIEKPDLHPNLQRANLQGVRLLNANLKDANLRNANLVGAHLQNADLQDADLQDADLRDANLWYGNLCEANFRGANLRGANLRGADLREANLRAANLRGANLRGAHLKDANLRGAHLEGAHLEGAHLYRTEWTDIDLSEAHGLEEVRHLGPSGITTSTLAKSKGKIPEVFLRGCGLQDWEIEAAKLWNPDLDEQERIDVTYRVVNLQAESPIVLHSVLISYSHEDSGFVEKIEAGLDERRIRYWRDVHDMKAGRLETQLEKAIRMNPIVLLVLSESSVQSDWVAWELSKARELAKTKKRDALCPIALDDSWKTCDWPERLRRQVMAYNILDFSDPGAFWPQFEKLVDGIVEFYPPP